MVKLTFCLKRKPGMSLKEFQAYWYEKHAPLVAKHAQTLRIRRYVQTHSLVHEFNAAIRASRHAPEGYDGVAELWWDDGAALAAAVATPEGREAGETLLADERRFIDLSYSPLFVAEEHPVIRG